MPNTVKMILISAATSLAVMWVANNVDAVKKLTGTTNKYF